MRLTVKSLHKTFDILEYVILQRGRSVTPSEVADYVNLNLATCTRIMGELTVRGYLEKISRREGYAPGPMVTATGTRDNRYKRLASAAKGPVRELAESIGMQVNLSVMNGRDRIMLCYHSPDRNWQPWNSFTFGRERCDTATDMLLLAAMAPEAAGKIIKEEKLSVTMKKLDSIRKQGFVEFVSSDGVRVMGHLICAEGYPPAAIVFGLREGDDPEEIRKRSRETAEEIIKRLTPDSRAY